MGTSSSDTTYGYLECASGMNRCGLGTYEDAETFLNLEGTQANSILKERLSGFTTVPGQSVFSVNKGLMCMSEADCTTLKAPMQSSCVGATTPCCCSGDGCTGAAGGLSAFLAGAMAIVLTAMRM